MDESAVDRFRREIEEVHAFIAAWFRGDIEQTEDAFESELAGRLDASLINIQPSGRTLSRSELIEGIRAGYGRNQAFSISISDVTLHRSNSEQALVTYVELQRGAKNTVPSDNTRVSTVLFGGLTDGSRLQWLHIHETAVS